ncbi:hypothetical protein DFH06DRAFT_1146647 [Mycena polygramma]|nr:hypothetical protein DFH06DRAFT_1146647 [Mycena polygramma]
MKLETETLIPGEKWSDRGSQRPVPLAHNNTSKKGDGIEDGTSRIQARGDYHQYSESADARRCLRGHYLYARTYRAAGRQEYSNSSSIVYILFVKRKDSLRPIQLKRPVTLAPAHQNPYTLFKTAVGDPRRSVTMNQEEAYSAACGKSATVLARSRRVVARKLTTSYSVDESINVIRIQRGVILDDFHEQLVWKVEQRRHDKAIQGGKRV